MIFRLFMLAIILMACETAPPTPRPLVAGEDFCNLCRMTIDQPNQGAEIVALDGTVHPFDNPVCALTWWGVKRAQDSDFRFFGFYLADHTDDQMVPAQAAFIIQGEFTTAMGYGLLAFARQVDADSMIAELGGRRLTFDDLRIEHGTPDHSWDIHLNGGQISPDNFSAGKGNLVEVACYAEGNAMGLKLQGYNIESPILKAGERYNFRFIANLPGTDFGIIVLPSGQLAGKFSILGAHFTGEQI